jgi:hypothetical protein
VNGVSISIDHSTLDQDFHSKELLSASVLTTLLSRDGETIQDNNNGISMVSPRLLRTTTGSLTHLIFNPMADHPTLDAPLPTQDGGNSGEPRVVTSSMRKERYSKFKTKT